MVKADREMAIIKAVFIHRLPRYRLINHVTHPSEYWNCLRASWVVMLKGLMQNAIVLHVETLKSKALQTVILVVRKAAAWEGYQAGLCRKDWSCSTVVMEMPPTVTAHQHAHSFQLMRFQKVLINE